jgi:hypothetical protein
MGKGCNLGGDICLGFFLKDGLLRKCWWKWITKFCNNTKSEIAKPTSLVYGFNFAIVETVCGFLIYLFQRKALSTSSCLCCSTLGSQSMCSCCLVVGNFGLKILLMWMSLNLNSSVSSVFQHFISRNILVTLSGRSPVLFNNKPFQDGWNER